MAKERPKRNPDGMIGKYEFKAGKLQAFDELSGETISHDVDIWRECCTYAHAIYPDDTQRAKGRAHASHKNITGHFRRAAFQPYNHRPCDRVVADMADRAFKAWIIKKKYWSGSVT